MSGWMRERERERDRQTDREIESGCNGWSGGRIE